MIWEKEITINNVEITFGHYPHPVRSTTSIMIGLLEDMNDLDHAELEFETEEEINEVIKGLQELKKYIK